jgi:Ser/Thr protein kinase RdoA (MazF antagonist)
MKMLNVDIEERYTEAAWAALDYFPIKAESLDLVSHSENVTFRVSPRSGGLDYVLRLHRPGYCSIEELESERVWVSALKETGVTVQESVETLEGGHFALVDIPGSNEQCYVGMTAWHEGEPLRDYLATCSDGVKRAQLLRRFGEIVAAFHNQSTGWSVPSGFVRRRLDQDALLGEAPFWGRFWEHPELTAEEQSLLRRAKEWGRDVLSDYGEKHDNFSLIHADFTPDNIIYDGNNLAIIDFDDAAFGWHAYDLASVLVECQFDDDYAALEAALLEGYRTHRSMEPRDIDMLPSFKLIRGMAIIGWFYQRPEHAGSAYFERFKTWVLDACVRRRI